MRARANRTAAYVATFVAALAVVAATGACAEVDRPSCYAGDFVSCSCGAGTQGYASCATDGRYGACTCDGRTPGVDGSTADAADAAVEADADAATVDAGKRGFMGTCVVNDDCETGLFCKDFPSRGAFCTRSCTTATAATDCPPPSPGCNKDNICKAP